VRPTNRQDGDRGGLGLHTTRCLSDLETTRACAHRPPGNPAWPVTGPLERTMQRACPTSSRPAGRCVHPSNWLLVIYAVRLSFWRQLAHHGGQGLHAARRRWPSDSRRLPTLPLTRWAPGRTRTEGSLPCRAWRLAPVWGALSQLVYRRAALTEKGLTGHAAQTLFRPIGRCVETVALTRSQVPALLAAVPTGNWARARWLPL